MHNLRRSRGEYLRKPGGLECEGKGAEKHKRIRQWTDRLLARGKE